MGHFADSGGRSFGGIGSFGSIRRGRGIGGFRRAVAGSLINGVHSVQHRIGGDGRTADGVDIAVLERQGFAHELIGKLGILGFGAQAVGFGKLVVADFDALDGQAVIQSQRHGHGAGKALRTGRPGAVAIGSGSHGGGHRRGVVRLRFGLGGRRGQGLRLVGGIVGRGLIDRVDAVQHGGGGHGRAADAVHIAVLKRQGLADELLLERGLQRLRAIALGLGKLIVADLDALDGQVVVQGQSHHHGAAEALEGRAPGAVLIELGDGRFLLGGSSSGGLAGQLSVDGVDGVDHGGGGDGRAGDGVDVRKRQRGLHTDELRREAVLKGFLAVAFGFVEIIVANGDGGDGTAGVQLKGDGHGAAEALRAGGIGRSAAAEVGDILARQVDTAVDSGGSAGRAGNGVDGVFTLGFVPLDQGEGHLLADVLLGKRGLLGQSAQARRFAEVLAAHVNAGDHAVHIHAQRDHDFAAVAVHSGLNDISHRFAGGIQALVYTVHVAAFGNLHGLKAGGNGKHAGAGFFRGTLAVLLDGVLGQQIEAGKKQRRDEAYHHQWHHIPHVFLAHNGYSSLHFSMCSFVTFACVPSGAGRWAQKKAPRHAGENLREAAAAGRDDFLMMLELHTAPFRQ